MKILITLISILLPGFTLQAQTSDVQTMKIHTCLSEENQLQVGMDLILPADLKVQSARMMVFTPILKKDTNERILSPIYVYGRKRKIVNRRNHRQPIEGSTVVTRYKHQEQIIPYTATVAFEPWMRNAEIILEKDLCGCGNQMEDNSKALLANVSLPEPVKEFTPPLIGLLEEPTLAKEETFILNGKSFIDFPVNKTVIYPQYRKNPIELARIDSTLEGISLENIRHIWLHGYASPESPYAHNDMLSKGRTEALKKHIVDKYKLDESIITLESTPEDWEGLIGFAEACNWPEKERILEIARSNAEPDQKEAQLRKLTNAYQRMSQQWFPALRHTDYRIEYVMKKTSSDSTNE